MAYIGREPLGGEVILMNSIESQFNGVLTTFNLTRTVSGVTSAFYPVGTEQLLVSLGGVIQQPDPTGNTGFRISSNTIIFAIAPVAGASCFIVAYGNLTDIGAPANNTVTTDKLVDGSVTPIKLSTGGPWWLSNGNVGIGTTNPSSKLSVNGTTKSSSDGALLALSSSDATNPFTFTITRSEAGADGYYALNSVEQNVGYRNIILNQTGGNVGIGITNPAEKLYVNGTTRLGGGIDYGSTTVLSVAPGTVYFDGPGTVGSRLTITSTGNVGIGSPDPTTKLDVISSAYPTAKFNSTYTSNSKQYTTLVLGVASTNEGSTLGYVYDTITPANSFLHITPYGSAEGSSFVVGTTGNVGIGIANPGSKLDVYNDSNDGNVARIYNDEVGLAIGSWGDGSTYPRTVTINGSRFDQLEPLPKLRIAGQGGIEFAVDLNSVRAVIDSSGNVGIGTTNPGVKLDVHGNSATVRVFESPSGADVRMVAGGSTGYFGTYNSNNLQILTGGATAIIANTSQNVGIGGAIVPDVRLHINGSNAYPATSGTTPTGFIALRNTAGATHGAYIGVANQAPWGTWIQAQDKNNLGTSYPILLNPNGGNVGIGITNPSNKLNIVSSAGSGTTVAKFTESTSASDTTSFIAIQTGYPQTSETEGLVRLGVLRNGSGNSASMIFETSTGNSTVRRAIMTNGGFASDFILLSTDNNHQIRSYIDAQKYFDVQGGLDRASYNGTSIGLASRSGYSVDLILYLGGKQPLLPSGWTGTISCVGNANSGSLGTTVYLQTSTNGITWTTRAQTENTWNVTLSWTQSTAENVPIFVRFRLLQNSGGNVGEGSCRISDIRITNLFVKPFGFGLANKLISQYSYQNTTVSSDLIDYQISLLGGTGAYASNNIGHGIAFYCPGVSTDSTGSVVAAINSIDEGNQDAQGLSFCTANSTIGSLSEKLRISNSGNVGIGTTNPTEKLHINGGKTLHTGGTLTGIGPGTYYTIPGSMGIPPSQTRIITVSGLQAGWATLRGGGYSSAGQSQCNFMYHMGGFMTSTSTYDVHAIREWITGGTITTSKTNNNWTITITNNSALYTLSLYLLLEGSTGNLTMSAA
jgi:hypothetical protein